MGEVMIDCNTGLPFDMSTTKLLKHRLLNAGKYNLTTGCAKNGTIYNWTTYDYLEAPLGFLIGALNALGEGSQSNYCSRYSNSARS